MCELKDFQLHRRASGRVEPAQTRCSRIIEWARSDAVNRIGRLRGRDSASALGAATVIELEGLARVNDRPPVDARWEVAWVERTTVRFAFADDYDTALRAYERSRESSTSFVAPNQPLTGARMWIAGSAKKLGSCECDG